MVELIGILLPKQDSHLMLQCNKEESISLITGGLLLMILVKLSGISEKRTIITQLDIEWEKSCLSSFSERRE
jgi:hypothetical protein